MGGLSAGESESAFEHGSDCLLQSSGWGTDHRIYKFILGTEVEYAFEGRENHNQVSRR